MLTKKQLWLLGIPYESLYGLGCFIISFNILQIITFKIDYKAIDANIYYIILFPSFIKNAKNNGILLKYGDRFKNVSNILILKRIITIYYQMLYFFLFLQYLLIYFKILI